MHIAKEMFQNQVGSHTELVNAGDTKSHMFRTFLAISHDEQKTLSEDMFRLN